MERYRYPMEREATISLLTIVGIAIGLAMDATAVAIGTSMMLGNVSGRQIFRFAFHFGLFQAAMPILGWFAGRELADYIASWDHWVAFGLLSLIGGKAIFDVLVDSNEKEKKETDPTRGGSLVLLSIATSIDALAVGLSMALLNITIWYPAAIIGITTAILTILGMILGSRVGQRFGKGVRILGGVILIGIGIKILLEFALFG
jgi:manganese efflux pump family protein